MISTDFDGSQPCLAGQAASTCMNLNPRSDLAFLNFPSRSKGSAGVVEALHHGEMIHQQLLVKAQRFLVIAVQILTLAAGTDTEHVHIKAGITEP